MSTTGGILFYGFEFDEEFITDLMSDFPEDEWGYVRYGSGDVVPRIEELVLSDDLKVGCHGNQDVQVYYLYTHDHYIDSGSSKRIEVGEPLNRHTSDLEEEGKRLGIDMGESRVGWYLAAFYD